MQTSKFYAQGKLDYKVEVTNKDTVDDVLKCVRSTCSGSRMLAVISAVEIVPSPDRGGTAGDGCHVFHGEMIRLVAGFMSVSHIHE